MKNILHIFCDQFRADAIGALGNPYIKTPNIDRLVNMGVTFSNAYTPSPVCISARCSMIMGKYPTKTDCYANVDMPEWDSFMHKLTEKGYTTHGIGKCHFKPISDALRGFQTRERQEECKILEEEKEPYYSLLKKEGFNNCYEPHGTRSEMYYIPQNSKLPERLHPTQWVGDRTVDFIQKHDDGQPWYLFSSYIHPHPPFSPPVPWHDLYRMADMPAPYRPYDFEHLQMFINKIQNRYKYRDNGWDENLVRTMKAYYYACITFIDKQIGRTLDILDQTRQLENTTIIFSADHGELLGDFGCFGKRSMHDASANIPFIVYEKDCFEGGKTCDIPVSLVDLAPTFAGDDEAMNYDGVNLRKLYSGETEREYVYSFYSAYEDATYANVEILKEHARETLTNMMITNKEYKYVYSVPDQREFLFRKGDESMNLAGVQNYDSVIKEMKNKLFNHLKENGEDIYIDGDDWRVFDYTPQVPLNPRSGLVRQDTTIPWFDIETPKV